MAPLLAGEARLSLFEKRLRALDAILGGPKERRQVVLETEAVVERQAEPLHDRLLRVAQRHRRLLRERPRERLGGGLNLARRDHALDEPDPERLARVDARAVIISSALPRPTSRGRRCVPPPPGMIARFTSVRPSWESSPAIRMSQASASSRPPPSAKPRIAAMIGWPQRSIAGRKSTRRRASRKRTGTWGATNSRMSAPAEDARAPPAVARITVASRLCASSPKQRGRSSRMR